jgi:hypothetical protein
MFRVRYTYTQQLKTANLSALIGRLRSPCICALTHMDTVEYILLLAEDMKHDPKSLQFLKLFSHCRRKVVERRYLSIGEKMNSVFATHEPKCLSTDTSLVRASSLQRCYTSYSMKKTDKKFEKFSERGLGGGTSHRRKAKAERVDRISFFVGSRLQNGPLCVRDFLRDSQRQRLPAAFGVWKFGNSYRDIGRVTVYDVTQEIVERSAALGEVRESFPFSSSIT